MGSNSQILSFLDDSSRFLPSPHLTTGLFLFPLLTQVKPHVMITVTPHSSPGRATAELETPLQPPGLDAQDDGFL